MIDRALLVEAGLLTECEKCDGSGHDNTKFCPATAWADEGTLKAGDPDGRCHPCSACGGRGYTLNPERLEAVFREGYGPWEAIRRAILAYPGVEGPE